jgi:xanthine/uracil permease
MMDLRYTLDQRPPPAKNLLYAIQWLVVVLPLVMISARLMAAFLNMDVPQAAVLFQKMLLLVGVVTAVQCFRGHRYPLVDGPSAALLLSVAALAPEGYGTVLGGMLTGGLLLFLLGAAGMVSRLTALFTGRIVGVVLILISLTFLPYLYPMVIGKGPGRPDGDPFVLAVACFVTLAIILISNYGKGYFKNLSILIGIFLGYGLMAAGARLDLSQISRVPFLSIPWPLAGPRPEFSFAGTASFFMANVAVLINGLGSYTAVAEVVGDDELEKRVKRGITMTGAKLLPEPRCHNGNARWKPVSCSTQRDHNVRPFIFHQVHSTPGQRAGRGGRGGASRHPGCHGRSGHLYHRPGIW